MPWAPGVSGNPAGGRPETIEVKEVRRLAQTRSLEAFKIIEALMVGADKDSVRLAAAISVLKLAGVQFDREIIRDVTPPSPTVESPPSTARLLSLARGSK